MTRDDAARRLAVAKTEKELLAWMGKEDGPGLITLLEALARVCLSVASNKRDHVLSSSEAEHVWTPAAKRLVAIKRFVEKQRAAWCPARNKEIRSPTLRTICLGGDSALLRG